MTKLLDLLVTYSLSKCLAHIFQRDNFKKNVLKSLAHCTIKRLAMITNNVTVPRNFTSSKRHLVKAVRANSIMLSNKGFDVWTVGLKADFKCCFLIINYKLYTELYSSHSVINVVCAAKAVFKYTLKYKKVGVLPIRMVKSRRGFRS